MSTPRASGIDLTALADAVAERVIERLRDEGVIPPKKPTADPALDWAWRWFLRARRVLGLQERGWLSPKERDAVGALLDRERPIPEDRQVCCWLLLANLVPGPNGWTSVRRPPKAHKSGAGKRR